MKQIFEKTISRFPASSLMNLSKAEKQPDLTLLARHIVAINTKDSSTEIINEIADCLKSTLNYRLFAFVLQKKTGVDVWLDPGINKNSMEDNILQEFKINKKENLTYLNHKFAPDEQPEKFRTKDLVYYDLSEKNCYTRLYMLPQKTSSILDNEVVNLILQGGTAALSKQVKIENLNKDVAIDPLTGCYNRREFENQLKRHIAATTRHKKNLSLFMFDLDHFKLINDTHGHPGGDLILKAVSALVKNNIREGDILARHGGEEFIVILPETDKANAIELANRIRTKIANLRISHNDNIISVTASFGVSELTPNADMNRFIEDADTMLYKAKLNGRNTVMPGMINILPQRKTNRKEASILFACHGFLKNIRIIKSKNIFNGEKEKSLTTSALKCHNSKIEVSGKI